MLLTNPHGISLIEGDLALNFKACMMLAGHGVRTRERVEKRLKVNCRRNSLECHGQGAGPPPRGGES